MLRTPHKAKTLPRLSQYLQSQVQAKSRYSGHELDLKVRDYRFVKIRDNTIIKGR